MFLRTREYPFEGLGNPTARRVQMYVATTRKIKGPERRWTLRATVDQASSFLVRWPSAFLVASLLLG